MHWSDPTEGGVDDVHVSSTDESVAYVLLCHIRGGMAFAPVSFTERGLASEGGVASVLVTTPTKGGMALHLSVPQKEVWPLQ